MQIPIIMLYGKNYLYNIPIYMISFCIFKKGSNYFMTFFYYSNIFYLKTMHFLFHLSGNKNRNTKLKALFNVRFIIYCIHVQC